jgi:hypothetical protein
MQATSLNPTGCHAKCSKEAIYGICVFGTIPRGHSKK